MTADAIEDVGGADAVPSAPIDVIPAFVDSGQALGSSATKAIALGDLDGDLDLICAELASQAAVWLNE